MGASGLIDTANGAGALATLRTQLRAATLRPEGAASGEALADLTPVQGALERAGVRAARWVEVARADQRSRPLVERMLEQFPLDSAQGNAGTVCAAVYNGRRVEAITSYRIASDSNLSDIGAMAVALVGQARRR